MTIINKLAASVFSFYVRYSWPLCEQRLVWKRTCYETWLPAKCHSSVPFFESDATKSPVTHLHISTLLMTKRILSRITSGSVVQPGRDLRFTLAYLLGLTLR